MRIKNFILVLIISIIISKNSFSENIEIQSSNMKISEEGNIITAFEASTIIKNENIKIDSNKTKYNKSDEIIIFTDKVFFHDINKDIKIFGDKITYNKNKDLIFSNGPTKINIENSYAIESSDIFYDRKSKLIYSDKETFINDRENNFYDLKEKFNFDIVKEIIKSKSSVIIDKNNNQYIFEDLIINLKNNEIAGNEIKINFRDDYFNNEKNDPMLRGRSGHSDEDELKIYKAVFSTCNIKEKKCRGWELNSEEFNHDKKKKIFEYKNSWFKMFDYKLFYLPYFNHPDPTVKRKSGFLTPSYSSSASLGTSINFPYFKIIDVDKDITFSPRYYADKSFLLQNEYRQAFQNSDVISDFSFLVGDAGTKGHFFYNQEGDLSDNTKYKLNLQSVKGDNYLKTYKFVNTSPIIKNDNLLLSNFDMNWDFVDSKLSTSFKIYEDLSRNKSDRYQYIFPKFNFEKNVLLAETYDGSLTFFSDGYNKNYNSNIFESVLINDFLYESKNKINASGLSTNFSLLLKNTNSYANNSTVLPENTKYDLFETVKIDFTYPLQKKMESYTHYIKPKASFRYSPNGNTNISTKDLTLNYDNAFSLNRISTNSQVEGGEALTLGVEFQRDNNLLGERFKLRFGNILKLKEDKKLPSKSKLNKTRSDIFGDMSFKINELLKLGYAFSYDRDLDYSNLDSLIVEMGVNNLVTKFNYYTENHDFGDSENLSNVTTINLNSENSLKFKSTRNLRDNFTEYYNLNYEYLTDCLSINLNYNKSYYRAGSLEPDETLNFLIKIIPFTEFGVKNLENLVSN